MHFVVVLLPILLQLMLTSIATVFVAIFTILYAFIKYRQSKMHRVRVPDGVDMAKQMIEISVLSLSFELN